MHAVQSQQIPPKKLIPLKYKSILVEKCRVISRLPTQHKLCTNRKMSVSVEVSVTVAVLLMLLLQASYVCGVKRTLP